MTGKILFAILLCLPMMARGETDLESIGNAGNTEDLKSRTYIALQNLTKKDYCKGIEEDCTSVVNTYITDNKLQEKEDKAQDSEKDSETNSKKSSEEKAKAQEKVDDAQAELDAAKEKEQSTANRMLGGLTTLATGIGGMQLAQGIAEKKADSAADKDMNAYIATMKCTYGDGKSVPFSVEPVELPGGNNADLMKYRTEYIALAKDLKERKTALDLKPGIEAEEIIDKATAGLYDDENKGITGGTYASRYRAATGSEQDQKGLAADKKEAKTRMIAGGVVAGVGVVGGIIGNSIINGKLGELIRKGKGDRKKASAAENRSVIKDIKSKAKDAGLTDPDYIDKWKLEDYNVGAYSEYVDDIEFKSNKNKRIRDLCPKLNEDTLKSCASKLLTKQSRKDLLDDIEDAEDEKNDNSDSSSSSGLNLGNVSSLVGAAGNAKSLLGGGS